MLSLVFFSSLQFHFFSFSSNPLGKAENPSFSQLKPGSGGMVQNNNPRAQQGEGEKKSKKRKRKGAEKDGEEKEYVGPWKPHPELEQYKLPEAVSFLFFSFLFFSFLFFSFLFFSFLFLFLPLLSLFPFPRAKK